MVSTTLRQFIRNKHICVCNIIFRNNVEAPHIKRINIIVLDVVRLVNIFPEDIILFPQTVRLKVTIDYRDYCSMEVKAYGNKA